MRSPGSFLLFALVVTFLREFRKKHRQRPRSSGNQQRLLSEYLLGFLVFFGFEFDPRAQEIHLSNGGEIRAKSTREAGLCVFYYRASLINLGAQAYRAHEAFSCFRNRFRFLANYKFEARESVLKFLVNASCRDFRGFLDA